MRLAFQGVCSIAKAAGWQKRFANAVIACYESASDLLSAFPHAKLAVEKLRYGFDDWAYDQIRELDIGAWHEYVRQVWLEAAADMPPQSELPALFERGVVFLSPAMGFLGRKGAAVAQRWPVSRPRRRVCRTQTMNAFVAERRLALNAKLEAGGLGRWLGAQKVRTKKTGPTRVRFLSRFRSVLPTFSPASAASSPQKIFWNVTATLPPPRGRTDSDDWPLSSMRKPLRRSA